MAQFRRFLALPSKDRRLLIRAALLVALIRVGLWLIPFDALRRIVSVRAHSGSGKTGEGRSSPSRIAWAVQVVSRYLPGATCLVQALAAQRLLERKGHPARLHIGVARNEEGLFQAHAWVESRGEIVVGGLEARHYTPLV